ncbi:MAG TPA: glycosyltransferase family 2 protein, partial [Verrucomicrobiota bacterium]|nr:glycosyltransferase family 2 protein [Verrucomicrobiota bacterium]
MDPALAHVVVIPCWNEAATIGSIVGRVRVHVPDVIVVDDGSTDATGSIARDAGALVERHRNNLGKGAALRSGLARASAAGFAWALTLDGDGQHSPEEIPAFIERAARTGAALVVGDRTAGAAGWCAIWMPPTRRGRWRAGWTRSWRRGRGNRGAGGCFTCAR